MADLRTQYMGLDLGNPLMVSSSGLTGSVDGVKACADYGAGAVVLKSMFEELIVSKSRDLDMELLKSEHPEAYDYVSAEIGMQLGPLPYLRFIEDARNQVDIPVIASVNCISPRWWVPYAQDIESAGAHAIELNISHFPQDGDNDFRDIERQYVRIAAEVCSQVKIPVSVKIGPSFTSISDMARDISATGARGLVLFNRYYTVDVNTETGRFVPAITFSSPEEISLPLRWTGLLANRVLCDIAASTGIHDSLGVIKVLLAGAKTACLCTALYKNGVSCLKTILDELNDWLDSHGHHSVSDIRGLALREAGSVDVLLHRLQYIKALDEAGKYERRG